MYKKKTVLGLVTARGGSQSIPGKNIKILSDEPLIAYTIKATQESKYLTRCIVSSDDQEIINISKEYGIDVPFVRPSELAGSESTGMEVAQHAIAWLEEHENQTYDYLMILQPTSPLREAYDIDECIKKIVDHDADSVMSMVELMDFSLTKLKKIEEGIILPFVEEEGKESSPRQYLEKIYKRNCAIYLTKTDLIKKGDLFGKKSLAYVMSPERSVDYLSSGSINQESGGLHLVKSLLIKHILCFLCQMRMD